MKFKAMIASSLIAFTSLSLAEGPCGPAPKDNNPDFCQCFFRESQQACLKANQPAPLCVKNVLMLQIKGNSDKNFSNFCRNYQNMRPAGVSNQECVDDMKYVKHHCK